MTQEEKQLLLKDLCARLPYGVIVEDLDRTPSEAIELSKYCMCEEMTIPELILIYADSIKPYLRPMSSMTEEEIEICRTERGRDFAGECGCESDYLNSIHVDYRGLITRDLALEAPEGMYKNE